MDLGTPALFRWDDLPREAVTPALGRKIITGERVMMAHIWLDQGCVVPEHSHEAEQLSWIFSGALKFIIGGETVVVRAGEMLVIPSWVPHEAVALEPTYEMDVFSPIRRDWLERSDAYFNQPPTRPAGFTNPATGANPAVVRRWSDVPVEPMSPMIDRAFVTGERATVADMRLKRGCVVPAHAHESEQLTWVRSGTLQLDLDGQPFVVPAGSVLRIPSNVSHEARALEACEVVDLFGPRRDDWLQRNDQYLRQEAAKR